MPATAPDGVLERPRSRSGTLREPDDLSGLSMFVRIVEEGSLSAAGRALGLPERPSAATSRSWKAARRAAADPLHARAQPDGYGQALLR